MKDLLDHLSIKMMGVTMLGGLITDVTKSGIALFFTVAVGTANLIYLGIKCWKELKTK